MRDHTFALMLTLVLAASGMAFAEPKASPTTLPTSPDDRFVVSEQLHADDFDGSLDRWTSELQDGGTVATRDRALEIDVPAGATVWFKPQLEGAVLIEYDATVIQAGGPNDRLSDLNCFWMARDSRNERDLFAVPRDGTFREYNALLTYYVGLGGNDNTTTRFRRYIGSPTTRPLLPEHDRREPADLLVANRREHIRLVAAGPIVQFFRGEQRVFDFNDPQPHTAGRFAFRTTSSHLRIESFRVYRLAEKGPRQ